MQRRVLGIDRDRLTDQILGQVFASGLVGKDSQQVKAVTVARINRQYLPKQPFGVAQVPVLKAAHRNVETRLDPRRRGWFRRSDLFCLAPRFMDFLAKASASPIRL